MYHVYVTMYVIYTVSKYHDAHKTSHSCLRYDNIYIPRTQLSSIFEGQPSKTRPFSIKTRVIWVLGIYMSIYTYMN